MTTYGSLVLLTAAMTLLCALTGTRGHALGELSGENFDAAEYPDYKNQRDMPKRAALLLDRLLVALQKAVESDEMEKERSKPYARSLPEFSDMSDSQRMHLADEKTMDLQRRGQAKGRIYWRCYFNAVTCFKRK